VPSLVLGAAGAALVTAAGVAAHPQLRAALLSKLKHAR
jgi:hypothetical protein